MTAKVLPATLPPVFLLYYFYFNFNGGKIKERKKIGPRIWNKTERIRSDGAPWGCSFAGWVAERDKSYI
jgi:hypothetical protein